MKRRDFVTGLGGAAALAACSRTPEDGPSPTESEQRFSWKMVTTWPPNFPGLGTGANTLARYIQEASGGRIQIRVYAAGELLPAFEIFDAVSRGSADMGHGAAYYWRGKTEAAQFFAGIPFGFNAHEMNAWLYYGGGLELWHEVYAPFNLVPFPAGNTGVQMGGWFKKPVNSIDDLKGLKMRIPGLGGEVLKRAGGTPVNLPGSEIFTALQTGSIDATEWVGPYNDVAFGLNEAARYYYYPGWQEPGPTMECFINKDAWNQLPEDLQAVVKVAAEAANLDMMAEFTARNAGALAQLAADDSVEIRPFPESVLAGLKKLTAEVIEGLAAKDETVAKVWASYQEFMGPSRDWQRISEQAILAGGSL
jgi:TRAP-type mannitol/chloroaromatic compound transport system substrate-binding protein